MPDLPRDDPRFIAAWVAVAGPAPPQKPSPGTIGALVTGFIASAKYQNMAPGTRGYMGSLLRAIREKWGHAKAADLAPRHILADLKGRPPHPANMRLKAWKALCRWGFQEAGLLDSDPAKPVAKRATPKSDGYVPWTRADVAAFRAYWPATSAQRLAMELIHRTGAAMCDAVRLGPGMVAQGWLIYSRQKVGSPCACPMTAAAPIWFEHDDYLAQCIAAQPGHMIWMTTRDGAPRSQKAASQWFSSACRKAGVTKTAHGLRKYRSEVWRENGASPEQRMAILGHESVAMTDHYSRGASLPGIISGTPNLQLGAPKVQLSE